MTPVKILAFGAAVFAVVSISLAQEEEVCCEQIEDSECLQLSETSGTCSASSCTKFSSIECEDETTPRCVELTTNAVLGSAAECSFNRTTSLVPKWAAGQVFKTWGYDGDVGPRNWGLAPGAELCSTGVEQSPVNLIPGSSGVMESEEMQSLGDLASHGEADFVTAQAKGAPRYDCMGRCGNMTLDGVVYDLVQFHMHARAEHGLAGLTLPMEFHFVHAGRSDPTKLAVLGVFVELGPQSNTALEQVLSAGTVSSSGEKLTFNPSDIYVGEMGFWRYSGSLTTPPCSEGVQWVVSKLPTFITAEQWAPYWNHIGGYPGNARDWQPLNARSVTDFASEAELMGPQGPEPTEEP